jgi:riboflavin biosynthesis pyrimidine reductase
MTAPGAVASPTVRDLTTLFEIPPDPSREARGGGMPARLERRYDGMLHVPLRPDRPTVIANFVSTLDGVVALGGGETGGGVISGFHEPDRFVMALLRAVADVVVLGAGTLRGSTNQRWIAEHLEPDLAMEFVDWRRAMGLAPHPTTIIVSGSGDLPLDHPGLNQPDVPVVIATTADGADRLHERGVNPAVLVESVAAGGPLSGADVIGVISRLGAGVALVEGGPHLLAEFVAADLLDELFLTIAPQLVGRGHDHGDRLGLVEGIALSADAARWHNLVSVRRSESHLFLRLRRASDTQSPGDPS